MGEWTKLGQLSGVLVACALWSGCGGEDDGRQEDSATVGITVTLSAGDGGSDGGTDPVDDDGGPGSGPGVLDVGSAGDEGGVNGCEELVEEADLEPRPQDIIFAIDTSGSMIQEAAFVQQQMNSFSIQIEAANVDARIIVLAEYPPIFGPGICIDPPLGSGGCPTSDSNPPKFLHVPDSDIASSDALQRLVELYSAYSAFLRPNAVTHVVVVSDDDSAMTAQDFSTQFTGLSDHLADFIAHGIISSVDPDDACAAGTACCQLAASQGTVYQELIAATGGVEGNLCDQQFQPIFQAVAQQVIGGASLACSYQIPPPPPGESFDRDEVNVEFEDDSGSELVIGRVDSEADCATVSDGWYYDDPIDPQRILVCPQTCDKIQSFETGKVAIKFGCETIPAG